MPVLTYLLLFASALHFLIQAVFAAPAGGLLLLQSVLASHFSTNETFAAHESGLPVMSTVFASQEEGFGGRCLCENRTCCNYSRKVVRYMVLCQTHKIVTST